MFQNQSENLKVFLKTLSTPQRRKQKRDFLILYYCIEISTSLNYGIAFSILRTCSFVAAEIEFNESTFDPLEWKEFFNGEIKQDKTNEFLQMLQ